MILGRVVPVDHGSGSEVLGGGAVQFVHGSLRLALDSEDSLGEVHDRNSEESFRLCPKSVNRWCTDARLAGSYAREIRCGFKASTPFIRIGDLTVAHAVVEWLRRDLDATENV
jgi:hypothetical protein